VNRFLQGLSAAFSALCVLLLVVGVLLLTPTTALTQSTVDTGDVCTGCPACTIDRDCASIPVTQTCTEFCVFCMTYNSKLICFIKS